MTPTTGCVDSATSYPPLISPELSEATSLRPALVMMPDRYQDYLPAEQLYGFLGHESECVVVRN